MPEERAAPERDPIPVPNSPFVQPLRHIPPNHPVLPREAAPRMGRGNSAWSGLYPLAGLHLIAKSAPLKPPFLPLVLHCPTCRKDPWRPMNHRPFWAPGGACMPRFSCISV